MTYDVGDIISIMNYGYGLVTSIARLNNIHSILISTDKGLVKVDFWFEQATSVPFAIPITDIFREAHVSI